MDADLEAIANRYRRHAAAFRATVAQVPSERWGAPTPCREWTVRDVARHVVESQGMFLGFIGAAAAPVPSVEDDPLGAVEAALGAVQQVLDEPATASATFEGFFGPTTFAAAVDRFLTLDLIVHRWDLARGAGVDDRIDPDELERIPAVMAALGEAARTTGAFGPPIEVPPEADLQTRVLGLLGRSAEAP